MNYNYVPDIKPPQSIPFCCLGIQSVMKEHFTIYNDKFIAPH